MVFERPAPENGDGHDPSRLRVNVPCPYEKFACEWL